MNALAAALIREGYAPYTLKTKFDLASDLSAWLEASFGRFEDRATQIHAGRALMAIAAPVHRERYLDYLLANAGAVPAPLSRTRSTISFQRRCPSTSSCDCSMA